MSDFFKARLEKARNSGGDITKSGDPVVPSGSSVGGIIVSQPGTERNTLVTSLFTFMECSSSSNKNKTRYCIVEQGVKPKYGNSFVNANGDIVHVVTKQVYTLMRSAIANISKNLADTKSKLEKSEAILESNMLLINTLKKQGVIS